MTELLNNIENSYPEIQARAPKFEDFLEKYKGKWIVLYFYPKDNTSGCTLEAQEFNNLLQDFHQLKSEVVGVSPDSESSHCKFKEKQKLGFPLIADEDKSILSAYGVWQKKSMYGRDYMGVVRTTFLVNPEGKIQYIWEKVKAKGHAGDVLHYLRSLN